MNPTALLNVKDSRWLQLEVCREFQRNKCTRSDTDCKFAHPASNVDVQNGRVVACYDSIKGRCNREKPPCKYFHPPKHLKDQLVVNGKNHLALKNAILHQVTPFQAVQLPLHHQSAASIAGLLNGNGSQAQSPIVSAATSGLYSNAYVAAVAAAQQPAALLSVAKQTQPNPYLASAANLPALAAAYGAYQHPQLQAGFAQAAAQAAAATANGNAAALLQLNSAAAAAAAAGEHPLTAAAAASLYSGHPHHAQPHHAHHPHPHSHHQLHPSLVRSVAGQAIVTPSVTPPASATSPVITLPITPGSGASLPPASGSVESQQSSSASTVVGQTVSSPSGVSAESNGSTSTNGSTSGLQMSYASYMQSNAAAFTAAAAAAAAAAGRKRARDPNDDLAMTFANAQAAAALAAANGSLYGGAPLTKRSALDKSAAAAMYLPFANPYAASASAAAASAAAATSVSGLATTAVPQSIVSLPINYYFPLVGQSNTLPRY